jgi:hypothetical protein
LDKEWKVLLIYKYIIILLIIIIIITSARLSPVRSGKSILVYLVYKKSYLVNFENFHIFFDFKQKLTRKEKIIKMKIIKIDQI